MTEINEKIDIKSLLPAELAALLKEMGEPAYRSKQIFSWLYVPSMKPTSRESRPIWKK